MLKELKSQHRNIIQMSFNGYKNNEIAERLEMSPSTVSSIIRSPLGQAYMEGLQDKSQEATLDVRKKLVTLNKAALNTFERILNPQEKAPHSVQFNAAKDVLDRNGYKAPDRLNIDMTLQTKTDEELDAEIAAIEASMKRTTGLEAKPENNLPEKITKTTQNTKIVITNPSPSTFPSSNVEPAQSDQSLEGLPIDDFDPFDDPNFDPFHNIKG